MTGVAEPSRPLRPTQPAGADLAALLPGAPAVRVTGVASSSRSVLPGDVYVGVPGATTHGARFAADAAAAGAVALVTDAAGAALAADALPVVVVDDPRMMMGGLAAAVYGEPATRLLTFGITGTNGKTTTLYLLAAALRAAGHRVGTIGTIGAAVDDERLELQRTTVTTPEAPDVQALLAVMLERGATAVVMEVSSHALALHRVSGMRFDAAGFTNLGWDHRDFHPTQQDYFDAKARLFTPELTASAVVCVDDEWGRRLAERVAASGLPLRTTGESGDYRAESVSVAPDGRDVRLVTPTGSLRLRLGLPGDHNVRNALTAVALLDAAGVPLEPALTGLATVTVPGRMQRVPLGEGAPTVFVDFAHTPQAVAAALASVNAARTVCVLGAGGDRDHAKRGPMGAAAAGACDVLVVTDDNPRSEPPEAIRAAVLAGAAAARDEAAAGSRTASCEVVDGGERRAAIREALSRAGQGDVVAVLGKGHEQGQDRGGSVTPFDDAEVVLEEWAGLRSSRGRAWM